ncbi:MAG: hypothetical protein ABIR87_07030 [Sphingomicrobium sp.]
MILIAFVPLLYPPVPPLVDLLGHMARYRVELDLANSPDLQRYFGFKWQLIGNLGVDLLIIPLSKIFGLELSVKLIAMSVPPITVAGFLWVAREVHHRLPPTAAMALPFAFSHPFLFGFLNYTLSMALAFLAFGLWLRLARVGKLRLRALLFIPISFVIFICHTFGWGSLGLLCFSAEAVRQHDKGIDWWKAGLRAAMHAAVMAGPLLLMLLWRSSVAHGMTSDWFNLSAKLMWLVTALRDRWQLFDMLSVAAALAMVGFAWRRAELTLSRNLAFSALMLLVFFLVLPRIVFGSAYADMRLVPFMIATALLAIRFKDRMDPVLARNLAWLGLAFYGVRIVATTASLAIAANNQSSRLAALDHVPVGARLVHLVSEDCATLWALPRNTHLGAMATVRRNAFSNDQWAVEGANLLSVHYAPAGRFMADPSQMVRSPDCPNPDMRSIDQALATIPRDAFDYVWTIDLPPTDAKLLKGYRLVWSAPGSRLYAQSPQPAKEVQ